MPPKAKKAKKVIYTVITNQYDHLFPPLADQDGWDLICFSDDESLKAEGWQVKPLPELPELEQVKGDPVRTARLVKILPHRFLQDYDYSLYMDANRILTQKAEVFVGEGDDAIRCLKGTFIDPYAAVKDQLDANVDTDELLISNKRLLTGVERKALEGAPKRWKKEKLPEYCGCPGTALLGRQHNDERVQAVMESWADEVIAGLTFDEAALPYACHVHGVKWVEHLSQTRIDGWMFCEAERFAVAVQHVRIGEEEAAFEKPVYEKNPLPPGGKYDGYPFLLTIGVPVSNQIGTIRRCLEGIKPILDAVPSELVVVDTGSTDGTVEVCLEYGARVLEFPWIDDMSAARNTAIRAAQGCWYMSIDDDEWFEDATPIIRFFKTGEYKKYNAATYNQRNFIDNNMTQSSDHPTQRMAKMTPGLHFEGRIHDLLKPEGIVNSVHIPASANHLGFVQEDLGVTQSKTSRNVGILKQEVAHYPNDLRFANQIRTEYYVARRFQDSTRMLYWIFSLARNTWGIDNSRWVHLNTIRGLACYNSLGENGREIITFYEQFINESEYNILDTCTIYSTLAAAYGAFAHEEITACYQTVNYAKKYFASLKQYRALIPERQEMQWADAGVDSVEDRRVLIVANYALQAWRLMNKPKAIEKFVTDKEMVAFFCKDTNEKYRVVTLKSLLFNRSFTTIETLLVQLAQENGADQLDYPYAIISEGLKWKDIESLEEIARKAGGKQAPVLSLLKLQKTDLGDPSAEITYREAVTYVQSTLFAPGNYFRGRLLFEAFRLKLDVDATMDLYDRSAADYMVQATMQKGGWWLQLRDNLLEWYPSVPEDDMGVRQYIAFHLALMHFRKVEMNREMAPDTYVEAFTIYIKRRMTWERHQRAEGLLDGDGSVNLPATLRAVCAANHALECMERGENTNAMKSLKLVIENEPSYKDVVDILNERLVQATKRQLDQADEMQSLLEGIKPKLWQMLEAGQVAEVRTLLPQLEQLAPNDLELVEIKNQVGTFPVS